jgi:Ca2+-binding EF-hand superfamily protein
MRYSSAVACALALTAPALSQNSPFGGFGGLGGGQETMRAMMNNPNMIFDQVARGKEYITRADLEALPPFMSGRALQMFDRTMQELGITNGQLTREQFNKAFEQGVQRFRNRGMGGPGGGANTEAVDRFVEERFRGLDKNSDGLLQLDEMPDALKTEREKWDVNKDGFVDITEYKAYTQARFGERGNERRDGSTAEGAANEASMISFGPAEPLPTERPTVYRAGKLPKELPAWFAQLDTDQDGQVGLYEWVRAGRSLSEYQTNDFNDDGFLTAEEVLRVAKNNSTPVSNGVLASNPSTETPSATRPPQASGNGNDSRRGPGGGGWGGFGGGRRGPGGGGWGGRGR